MKGKKSSQFFRLHSKDGAAADQSDGSDASSSNEIPKTKKKTPSLRLNSERMLHDLMAKGGK